MAALCKCGDVQQQHRMGEHQCRGMGCLCLRYEPDVPPPAEESTSARLRRVEQERDDALRRASDLEQVRWELKQLRLTADGLAEFNQALTGENQKLIDRSIELKAELASARTELDAVRTARDNLERELGEACATIRAMTGNPNPAGLHVTQSGPSTQGAPPE